MAEIVNFDSTDLPKEQELLTSERLSDENTEKRSKDITPSDLEALEDLGEAMFEDVEDAVEQMVEDEEYVLSIHDIIKKELEQFIGEIPLEQDNDDEKGEEEMELEISELFEEEVSPKDEVTESMELIDEEELVPITEETTQEEETEEKSLKTILKKSLSDSTSGASVRSSKSSSSNIKFNYYHSRFKRILIKCYLTDDIDRVVVFDMIITRHVQLVVDCLANYVHKDPEDIQLYYCGVKMQKKDKLLNYLCANEDTMHIEVKFEFDSSSESEISNKSFESNRKIQIVEIHNPTGHNFCLEVLVVNVAYTKEWCGGYRNIYTGAIYHNASTQTYPRRQSKALRGERVPTLVERSTETNHPTVDKSINTHHDKSTQVYRTGFYIPCEGDKFMTPNPTYQSYDKIKQRLTPIQAILILQRFFRLCIVRKRLKADIEAFRKQEKAANVLRGLLSERILRDRMLRLISESFPLRRGDFYDLYTIIGIWKKNEKRKIRETKDGMAKQEAMSQLFEKLVKCLYLLETQRIKSKNESLKRIELRNLERYAGFVVRKYKNGNLTLIDNLVAQRAREFKEIYSSYLRTDVKFEERLDIITTFKNMLGKLENIDITKDLIQLLDRECMLMLNHIPKKKLVGLQKRIEGMFLDLIKTPAFYKQVHYVKYSHLNKRPLYKCKGCMKIKPPEMFFSHLRLNAFKFCMSCSWMNTTSTASVNLAPYTRLLNLLRESEKRKCFRSAVAFLLQPMGMYYITSIIWNGRSCVSGSTYLPELRMTRWNIEEEWAPWNTILLTESEAVIHDALPDPEKYYTRYFILNIKQKLIVSRLHFDMVYYTDLDLRESGRWSQARKAFKFNRRKLDRNLAEQNKHIFFDPPPGQAFNGTNGEKVDVAC